MVAPEEPLHLEARPEPFVSRAGRKLDAALEAFSIEVDGMRALDIGASTGGFTDCLLQRGAQSVVAVDVGYGQMHWRIRTDDRVEVIERTNFRTVETASLGSPFDIVVADLSFISLRAVRDQLAAVGSTTGTWILLIKPQFEAGKERVGKGGIVRDTSVRKAVINEVVTSFGEAGLVCEKLIESPVPGTTGNIEYVALFRREGCTVTTDTIASIVDGNLQ